MDNFSKIEPTEKQSKNTTGGEKHAEGIDWYACIHKPQADKGYETLTVLPLHSSIGEARIYMNSERAITHMSIEHKSRLDNGRKEDLIYENGMPQAKRSVGPGGAEEYNFSINSETKPGQKDSYTFKSDADKQDAGLLSKNGKSVEKESQEFASVMTHLKSLNFNEPDCAKKIPGF